MVGTVKIPSKIFTKVDNNLNKKTVKIRGINCTFQIKTTPLQRTFGNEFLVVILSEINTEK